jgi:hypothetical protein
VLETHQQEAGIQGLALLLLLLLLAYPCTPVPHKCTLSTKQVLAG